MKITNEVMAVLSELEVEGTRVRIVQQLDRKLYEHTNKVLVALGGKWTSGKIKAHVFQEDAAPLIERALSAGEVTTDADLGFFPTPPGVAAWLVKRTQVGPDDTVLEPSAGTGSLVKEALRAGAMVWACERDRVRRAALRTLPMPDGVVEPRLYVLDEDDFMDVVMPPGASGVSRVVMNPPFYKVGYGDHLDHTQLAFSMLITGGRLGAILPASVRYRRDHRYRDFRAWVEALDGELVDMAEGSFKASGTNVRTVALFLTKGSR